MKVLAAPALLSTAMFSAAAPATVDIVAAASHGRSASRGERIFDEGLAGDEMFVVINGLVKLAGTSRDGDEVVYRSAGPGDTFGELSALDGGTRSASAVALKPADLLVIPGEALRRALRADAELAASVVQVVAGALRATTRQHADLLFVDLAGRVATYLVEQAGDTQRVELELSQGDLASLLGASRQSVNQVLRSFEHEGLIQRQGRGFEVARPADLRARAGL